MVGTVFWSPRRPGRELSRRLPRPSSWGAFRWSVLSCATSVNWSVRAEDVPLRSLPSQVYGGRRSPTNRLLHSGLGGKDRGRGKKTRRKHMLVVRLPGQGRDKTLEPVQANRGTRVKGGHFTLHLVTSVEGPCHDSPVVYNHPKSPRTSRIRLRTLQPSDLRATTPGPHTSVTKVGREDHQEPRLDPMTPPWCRGRGLN